MKFTVDGQDLFDPSRTPPRFLSMGFDDTQTPPRTTIIIKPLEKKEFIGYFRPYTNGEYLGLERFQTNDPKVPYLDIPLTGEGLLPIKTLSPGRGILGVYTAPISMTLKNQLQRRKR